MTDRIYLSPPDVGPVERGLLLAAFDSNWIAPNGPDVDAFEQELAAYVGVAEGVAVNSGTAALHLALRDVGVGQGDEVLVPTLTFVATANAVLYCDATPHFIDASPRTWGMDPELLSEELEARRRTNNLPAAVVVADMYGYCAEYELIEPLLAELGIPLVVDAAESLGSERSGRRAGSFGDISIVSFNGNKILTTSGGGMILTGDADQAARLRRLAAQAKEPYPWYEHAELGFNYRLSNLLAALGRGQLATLDDRIDRRADAVFRYQEACETFQLEIGPSDVGDRWNHWLTVAHGPLIRTTQHALLESMTQGNIEARYPWKPLHLQPLFKGTPSRVSGLAEQLFHEGICLPTGSHLSPHETSRVLALLKRMLGDVH